MVTRNTILTLIAAIALLWTGCSQQTVNSASQDVQRGVASANEEADQLAAKAKPALVKLDLGARVTTALRANANLPSSIRVDADTDGVRLRGSVDSAQQKSLAGKIAKETVPAGKSVRNELAVTSPNATVKPHA